LLVMRVVIAADAHLDSTLFGSKYYWYLYLFSDLPGKKSV